MLCFDKFTGEHNNKIHFKVFGFCGSISLKETVSKGNILFSLPVGFHRTKFPLEKCCSNAI